MNITTVAKEYIKRLLTEKLDPSYYYHDLAHTLAVEEASQVIGKALEMSETELEILSLAALFHDTGFVEIYQGHEEVSKNIAATFLKEQNYPDDKIKQVVHLIDITKKDNIPETVIEKAMKDADLSNLGRDDYFRHLADLREEWALFLNEKYTDAKWYKLNHKFVKRHNYYTEAASFLYARQSKANEKQLKKMAKREEKVKGKILEGSIANSKSAQMMFKTALRNHLDLSNLADNKANIMLSVNALIITIAMPMAATYVQANPFMLVPTISLLISCLASMIFATLATRPIKMTGYTDEEKIKTRKSNLFFFGNFYNMDFDAYQTGMQIIINDEKNLENSIMRDLYFLGLSLGKKYRQLRICYNVFMVGVIITVIIFTISYSVATP
ncbi:MAG: hypothetical protein DHS20C18_55050 [Saprospiraceae bacterium]|nr:MAG: hypothetical protein DHS20C18_55050 [Saprospiraceae bacterium]